MFPNAAIDRLAEIFNACLRHRHYPKAWKEAKVIVFPKAEKPLRDPANYRPISMLSGLSKLFKKVILACLSDFASSDNFLAKEKFGFRKEHYTNHQVLRVVDIISHGFNINKSTGVGFLDVVKAFDRVWHRGLIYKLIKLTFSSYLVNLLISYLEEHTFHMAMREEYSTVCPILSGVPQGSILGPFVFNIFTNDIPKDLKKTDLALYADDIAVISQSFSEKEVAKNLEASLSKISGCVERLQTRVLEDIAEQGPMDSYSAPCFARTADIYRDLGIEMLDDPLRKLNVKFYYRDLGIEMLDDHLRKLNVKFYKGMDKKENPLIKKLADISANPFDRYPRPITALTM
ncbi:hypothetical protein NDU88_002739 [Pleurodeles waltl]|uniref:Reverse transcriptase domain-containing protein n=1 Tax=Pleurodeles waltl TaxID=8319 RepID=A0AAV7RBV8_PLEWA|nr:hypothetical protein NDU88_002739 [Pleurodeles waltl]